MSAPDWGQARVILLVEDNPGDVRLVQEALQHRGSSTRLETVRDGVEALAYLRREGKLEQVEPVPAIRSFALAPQAGVGRTSHT